ncbi:BtrH N-terminal domain-containing protein [Actinomadura rugatobispora]|uniref:BtrH N-terminal domain-containing protein n=1 Tax=Actinomadura rugatobispora TaxID=1994 RepID=A0ABW0ZQV5_9ACTN|nr:BtrH N-terminal domain-containing protein [Actinomadura rugatobispora]
MRIEDYPHRLAGHCGSGALRDLLDWAGLGWAGPPSEPLVFGLSGGLDFKFLQIPGLNPPIYLGGRTLDLEFDLCRRLGVEVEHLETDDPVQGWGWVTAELDAGRPVMIWADILRLPYLRVRLTNTRHDIVVVGYDAAAGVAWVADNDREEIQQVPLETLAHARDSRGFPHPNRHATFPMRFPERLPDLLPLAREAAAQGVANMSGGNSESGEPPLEIAGYSAGLAGVRDFAAEVAGWPERHAPETLATMYTMVRICIEKAGTGGGLFRRLQAGFCHDVAAITGDEAFHEAGRAWAACAEAWSALAAAAGAAQPDHAAIADQAAALPALEERATRKLAAAAPEPSHS